MGGMGAGMGSSIGGLSSSSGSYRGMSGMKGVGGGMGSFNSDFGSSMPVMASGGQDFDFRGGSSRPNSMDSGFALRGFGPEGDVINKGGWNLKGAGSGTGGPPSGTWSTARGGGGARRY